MLLYKSFRNFIDFRFQYLSNCCVYILLNIIILLGKHLYLSLPIIIVSVIVDSSQTNISICFLIEITIQQLINIIYLQEEA